MDQPIHWHNLSERMHHRRLCLLFAWGTLAIGIYVASSTVLMMIAAWDPVPFWDQWDELVSVRNVSWSWLISQHNEHRILLPRLVFITDRWLFGETNVLDFAVNALSQGALALLLVVLGSGSEQQRGTWIPWLVGLNLSFLFWATQYENFVWGIQVCVFLVLLLAASAFAVMALSRPAIWTLGLVLILEAAAVYTNANGIIAAFLMIPLALVLGRPRRHLVVLSVAAIGLLGTYLVGYHTPPQTSDPANAWRHLGNIVLYTLAFLGAPFVTALRVGANKVAISAGLGGLGAISLALIGWHLIRRPGTWSPREFVLFTLACFVLGSAVITGMGRAGAFGIGQAFASRYYTAVLLFWLCLIVLAANRVRGDGVIMASTLPILFVIMISQPVFVRTAESWANGHHVAVPALLSGAHDRALLENLYPDEEDVLKRREALKKAHTSVFADEWGRWLGKRIEAHLTVVDAHDCEGRFDAAEAMGVGTDPRGWRAYGDALNLSLRTPVERIILVGGDGKIVGFGVNDRDPSAIGRNAWVGSFVGDNPALVRAYAVVGNGNSACPLGLPKLVAHPLRLELSPEREPGEPSSSPGGYVDSIEIGHRTVIVGWGMLSPERSDQRIAIETNLPVSSAQISTAPRPDVVDFFKDDGLADSGISVALYLNAGEKIPAKIRLCVVTTDSRYGSHTLRIPSHPELCQPQDPHSRR